MEIPRHWRLKKQRYCLIGESCTCGRVKIFPPRSSYEDVTLNWIRQRERIMDEPKHDKKLMEVEEYWAGAKDRGVRAEQERQANLIERLGLASVAPSFIHVLASI